MPTSSLPDSHRVSQALDRNFVAIPAFQVTKGNKFFAATALGCILGEERRIAVKPCIHTPSRVILASGQAATLTGFETESGDLFVTDIKCVTHSKGVTCEVTALLLEICKRARTGTEFIDICHVLSRRFEGLSVRWHKVWGVFSGFSKLLPDGLFEL
jgi:hypothetical protein